MCHRNDVCRGDDPAAYDVQQLEPQFVSLVEIEQAQFDGMLVPPLTPLDYLLLAEFCDEELAQEEIRRWWWEPGPRTKYCSDCGDRFVDDTETHQVFSCPKCTHKNAERAREPEGKPCTAKYCSDCGKQFVDTSSGQHAYCCSECTKRRGKGVRRVQDKRYCTRCGGEFCPQGPQRYCGPCRDTIFVERKTERFCACCGTKFGVGVSGSDRYCRICKLLSRERPRQQ